LGGHKWDATPWWCAKTLRSRYSKAAGLFLSSAWAK
jgi:hypothetical protein